MEHRHRRSGGRIDSVTEDGETRASAHAVLRFVGANPGPEIVAERPLAGTVNLIRGKDPALWRTGIPAYGAVRYRALYPGIDLIFYGNRGELEFDLILEPGADPSQVRMEYEGADELGLDEEGNLLIGLGAGQLVQQRPVSYQQAKGVREAVASRFVLDGVEGRQRVRLQLGTYDPERPLVIDPVLRYASFYGGDGSQDAANAVALGSDGHIFLAGETTSTDLPQATGQWSGSFDAFVVRLAADGRTLVYATYLGGADVDKADDLAVDANGHAFVAGDTASSNFPTTPNAFQTSAPGSFSGFVAKLSPTDGGLVYGTYFGGSGHDDIEGIAVDTSGHAYLAGSSESTDLPLRNAYQTQSGGFRDVFVAKLTPAGDDTLYSTYLGGQSFESAWAIALDASGSVFIAGSTWSTDFPTTNPPIGSPTGTYVNVFVAKLSADGKRLSYGTLVGGSETSQGFGIAVDPSGQAHVAGFTQASDFPTLNPYQACEPIGPLDDAFVFGLSPAGDQLIYGTCLRGSAVDSASAIQIDGSGAVYVAGSTSSTDFPTTPDAFRTCGSSDAWLAILERGGGLSYASCLVNGSGITAIRDLAVAASGTAVVTGQTEDPVFPATSDAFQRNPGDLYDAFLAIFGTPAPPTSDAFHAAFTVDLEERPVIAYNSRDQELLAAYLGPRSVGGTELRVQRMDRNGAPLGTHQLPFGNLLADFRPALAYSPQSNTYLAAIAVENVAPASDSVFMALLDAAGQTLASSQLFFDTDEKRLPEGDSALHVTYNGLRDEFLVSVARSGTVDGQRVDAATGAAVGVPATLYTGSAFSDHAVAFNDTQGGRYLLVTDETALTLVYLDQDLAPVGGPGLLLNELGAPFGFGGEDQPDLAFGRLWGADRFLLVWSDDDNCAPGDTPPCDSGLDRAGIWGLLIGLDPSPPATGVLADFLDFGVPFPLQEGDLIHHTIDHEGPGWTPRVAYNRNAETFYVVWRVMPWDNTTDPAFPMNDPSQERRTHIRGVRITAPPGAPDQFYVPEPNRIVSPLTGGIDPCAEVIPGRAFFCRSAEDPMYPDIAAAAGFGAIAIWEQRYQRSATDHDIWLRYFDADRPSNNTQDTAQKITTLSQTTERTLVGATSDGVSSCGNAWEEPDVWYGFDASATGTLSVDTCGSHDRDSIDGGMDTVLSVVRAGDGWELGCNDDNATACAAGDQGAVRDSALSVHLYPGDEILARVSRYGGSFGGLHVFNLDFQEKPDSDGDGIADDGDFSGTVGDSGCATGQIRECDDNCPSANPGQENLDGDLLGDLCDGDDCVQGDLLIPAGIYPGIRVFRSEDQWLHTLGDVIIPSGADATLQAATGVTLSDGFRVAAGSRLAVRLGASSCATPAGVPSAPLARSPLAPDSGVAAVSDNSPGLERQRLGPGQLPEALSDAIGAAAVGELTSDHFGERLVFTTLDALAPEDDNGQADVYLFEAGQARPLSVSPRGEIGNGASNQPRIDARGRYLVFRSTASNLTRDPDTNGVADIFLVDLKDGTTERISWTEDGEETSTPSAHPDLGGEELLVVYDKEDQEGLRGIFADDRKDLLAQRQDPGDCDAHHPALSADAGLLAYVCGNPGEPDCSVRFVERDSGKATTSDCPAAINGGYEVYFDDRTNELIFVPANSRHRE